MVTFGSPAVFFRPVTFRTDFAIGLALGAFMRKLAERWEWRNRYYV